MTAPAMRTLRVSLVDLEITPAGPGGSFSGEVWAKLSRQVRTTDGQVVVLAGARKVVDSTGIVNFSVPCNDDAGIHVDDRGFGVTIGWDLTSRGARGSTVNIFNVGTSVMVSSADPTITQFALKAPAVPAPTIQMVVGPTGPAGSTGATGPAGPYGGTAVADTAIAAILATPASATATSLSSTYLTSISVAAYGAVGDYNGVSGTDNLAAFNAAHAAVVSGGRVFVPPGRYYLSDTFTISKLIDFDCGAGGISVNTIGTQLVFASGKSGIVVSGSVTGWRIGPFNIRSKSTVAGTDVGVFAQTAGFGTIDRTTVEAFGSHGFHIKAGAGVGGGIMNNTILNRPRAEANRGDGIRLEGTDTNAILITKPDVVVNYGWGINLEGCARAVVMAPHAAQNANGSPGAYRDNGNSNTWNSIYAEDSGLFQIAAGSMYADLSFAWYGAPVVTDLTAGKTAAIRNVSKPGHQFGHVPNFTGGGISTNGIAPIAITFPVAFDGIPTVTLTTKGNCDAGGTTGQSYAWIKTVTTDGFTGNGINLDSLQTMDVFWTADYRP